MSEYLQHVKLESIIYLKKDMDNYLMYMLDDCYFIQPLTLSASDLKNFIPWKKEKLIEFVCKPKKHIKMSIESLNSLTDRKMKQELKQFLNGEIPNDKEVL